MFDKILNWFVKNIAFSGLIFAPILFFVNIYVLTLDYDWYWDENIYLLMWFSLCLYCERNDLIK